MPIPRHLNRLHSARRLRAAGALTSVVALTAVTACSSGSSGEGAEDTDSLTIALQPWLGYGPWYIADEMGYYEDEGLELEITNFDLDSQTTAALGSGQIDLAAAATSSVLQWTENGLEGDIILMSDDSKTADAILSHDDITSIEDLAGKSVAYEEGSGSHLLLDYALNEAGMTIDDIETVPMGTAEAGTALASDRVDVAVTYEPFITDAINQDDTITRLYNAEEAGSIVSGIMFASEATIDEKPEALTKLIRAYDRAVAYYNENTDDARAMIATSIGSAPDDLASTFDGVEIYDVEQNRELLNGSFVDDILPSIEDSAVRAGVVTEKIDPASVVNTDFLE